MPAKPRAGTGASVFQMRWYRPLGANTRGELTMAGETNKANRTYPGGLLRSIMIYLSLMSDSTEIGTRHREIIGCALVGSFGILLLDALIFRYGVYYYSDDIYILYPVAVHNLTGSGNPVRPFEYLIVSAANNVYLPLWLGASLLCVVGATVLSGLACELLFERQLPKAGWWVLGVANPLLFYAVSQPDTVSQALCNLLFAGAMLAFVSELNRLTDQPLCGWRADRVAAFLNLMAAALFFTKETAVAAATIIPTATALMRVKARQLSPLFLCSLLLPIAAAAGWIFLKLRFPIMLPAEVGEGRYDLKLDPITWAQHLIVTLAFPITPLPTSFLGFELLRPLWVVGAVGFVVLLIGVILCTALRQPRIVLPSLIVAGSCAPMVLIYSSELYSTMIAPFAVSILLLFGISKRRWLGLGYGLLLYIASLTNGIIYGLGPDFNLFGLQQLLSYSIYGKGYQFYPICPIGTTAHVGWDGTLASDVLYHPGLKGRIICLR